MAAFPPRLTVFAVVSALLLPVLAGVEAAPAAAQSPGPANAVYRVRLQATDGAAAWEGRESVAFTNTSADTLTRVWFRLWANGVQGCRPRAVRIADVAGGVLAGSIRGCTAVAIRLDEPLLPGHRTRVGFDVRIRVPERNDRFGTHRGVTLMGGALPILAVRGDSGWHLDPYVDLGESFYSLVSTYRVEVETRADLDVAATGRLASQRRHGTRIRRLFTAGSVREFSFAVGRFQRLTADAGPTRVNVWFHPDVTKTRAAHRVLRDARTSMTTFSESFGAYPYPEVDIVTSAFTTFGGMEYPQIVFSNPNRLTVAHELAHQWWWGIVGNDEFVEPWLDESLATWSMRLPFSPWRSCQGYDWPSPTARITNDMGYWREHPSEYGVVYSGGGCMLADLAHEIGFERLVEALREHAAGSWLGVATGDQLRATLEAAAAETAPGLDMDVFWADWRAN